MIGPLGFGVLIGFGVVIAFAGIWRWERRRDPVAARLREYGVGEMDLISADSDGLEVSRRPSLSRVNRLLAGFGWGPRLSTLLARADLPLTAAEFVLIMVGAGLLGLWLGTLRAGLLGGLLLGLILGVLPLFYARYKRNRRVSAFTAQLPDILTLLTGALRAGHGLSQAMELLHDQMPPPASVEFGRVMRSVSLGSSVQRALTDMGERVGSDDLDLLIIAITVQYELGGNLVHTLETIGDTVRDRIRMLREIRVLTAQQRLTGYILAAMPIFVGVAIFMLNREYIMRLFEPGWIRILPVLAVIMQVLGFFVIRRIVDIEV